MVHASGLKAKHKLSMHVTIQLVLVPSIYLLMHTMVLVGYWYSGLHIPSSACVISLLDVFLIFHSLKKGQKLSHFEI